MKFPVSVAVAIEVTLFVLILTALCVNLSILLPMWF